MLMMRLLMTVCFALLLSACGTSIVPHAIVPDTPQQATLPMFTGWYEGQSVYYITTDVSDAKMAHKMGANYAPRLRDAIPHYPKPPQVKTAIERVYTFPNAEQQRNVFASMPQPIGAASLDRHYSPIWLVYQVAWLDAAHIRELTSEGDIYTAEAQGWVTITRTNIVVNCPIIGAEPFDLHHL